MPKRTRARLAQVAQCMFRRQRWASEHIKPIYFVSREVCDTFSTVTPLVYALISIARLLHATHDTAAQAVKAARRKEHVAVCVVEVEGSKHGADEDEFLLVQRPAQGLLAGLAAAPSQPCSPASMPTSEVAPHVVNRPP